MRRSRCSTSTSSSSSCRSSVWIGRSVEATRLASALGSSTFVAASCSSAGRYGARPMIWPKRSWTLRVSASTSGVRRRIRQRLEVADEVRVGLDRLDEPDPVQAADEDPERSVGDLDHLVDDGDRAHVVDVVAARRIDRGVLRGHERQKRSPAATSSISRIERSCPIASGIIDCGKTTVSLSARIGSVAGRTISVSRVVRDVEPEIAHCHSTTIACARGHGASRRSAA